MNRIVPPTLVLGWLVAVVSSGCSAKPKSGTKPKPKTEQEQAIAEIKKLGGTVTVDKTSSDKAVIEVNLSETQVADAGLEHLKGLTQLQDLRLQWTEVTDAGLVHLNGLTKLKWLDMNATKVTDAGVKDLQKALPKCKIER
jgi:hypothetical protein